MIPKKTEVLAHARELFFQASYRSGIENVNSPEDSELVEDGFYQQALSELMTGLERKNEQWLNVESEYVDIPQDFHFDLKLGLEQGVFISGGRGCGKSSLTKTIVDVFLKEGYVVSVFDNSQTWRRSSIPKLAIIKPYSNFEPQYNESYVFDISLLSLEQQKSFIENVVDNDFNYTACLNENERNWRIYVFEEAELLVGTHDHSKTILRLVATGRNLRLSYIAVAQRFAMVSTNLISLCGQLYLGMMHEQNDLKKAYNWLGNNTKKLAKLDVGQFIRYSKGNVAKMAVELFATDIMSKLISVESKSILPEPKSIEPIKCARTHDTSTTIARWLILAIFVILTLKSL